MDVVQAGCSKGAALSAWAAGQGIPASQVMAVGDNLNDLEMLEFAGTAVVMANAIAAMKARGFAHSRLTTRRTRGGYRSVRPRDDVQPRELRCGRTYLDVTTNPSERVGQVHAMTAIDDAASVSDPPGAEPPWNHPIIRGLDGAMGREHL